MGKVESVVAAELEVVMEEVVEVEVDRLWWNVEVELEREVVARGVGGD